MDECKPLREGATDEEAARVVAAAKEEAGTNAAFGEATSVRGAIAAGAYTRPLFGAT